jgi:hypothetical protein
MRPDSAPEYSEYMELARTWARGVQSGRRINVRDRMQMYDLVHNRMPLVSDAARLSALWRAFEECVDLGIAQLLRSPSSVRELLPRLDAMAHFHEYAQSLSSGFLSLQRMEDFLALQETAGRRLLEPALVLQRLAHWHDRPRTMREVIKLVLQDRLGLPPHVPYSEIPGCADEAGVRRFALGVVDCERIDSLLLPFLHAHGAARTDWLLPSPYAFAPLPSKTMLAFVLCSKRAESPVSRLPIGLIRQALLFTYQCRRCSPQA